MTVWRRRTRGLGTFRAGRSALKFGRETDRPRQVRRKDWRAGTRSWPHSGPGAFPFLPVSAQQDDLPGHERASRLETNEVEPGRKSPPFESDPVSARAPVFALCDCADRPPRDVVDPHCDRLTPGEL